MRILREFRLEIGAMLLIGGIILTIFVVFNFFVPSEPPEQPDFLYDLIRNKIGHWIVWFMVIGPILLLAGGFYLGDTVKKYREFDRLIETDSKAKFVQNQDRIEYLAWLLSSRLEKEVEKKKKEFKIKT